MEEKRETMEDYAKELEASFRSIKEGDIITISFTGNGFMKYQVRNMVGVLIKIGSGKLTTGSVKNILNGTMDKSKITTAKGSGLYLKEVVY